MGSLLTPEQVTELNRIKNLNPATMQLIGYEANRDLHLYNILYFASDETAQSFIGAPQEWLDALYPDAGIFGPHFRTIEDLTEKIGSIGHYHPRAKIFLDKVDVNDPVYMASYNKAHMSMSRAQRQNAGDIFLGDERINCLQNKKGTDKWTDAIYGLMIGLLVRDLIDMEQGHVDGSEIYRMEDYNNLTYAWRETFGSICDLDEPIEGADW